MLIVSDGDTSLIISGTGDVIEPENDIVAIGSGGDYARASAISLLGYTDLSAEEIATISLKVASDICVYTNSNMVLESIIKE